MSMGLSEPILEAPSIEGPFDRLSVESYLEAIRTGVIADDVPVELIEGVLLAKMSKNAPRIFSTKRFFWALAGALPEGWHVTREDPIRTIDSVPEPDCMVLRGTDDEYRGRLPDPSDVALMVEVSVSSLNRDRGIKLRAYARASIVCYWIANLVEGRAEVYSDPSGPSETPHYRSVQHFGPDDQLPVVLEGREIARLAVRDLLP